MITRSPRPGPLDSNFTIPMRSTDIDRIYAVAQAEKRPMADWARNVIYDALGKVEQTQAI